MTPLQQIALGLVIVVLTAQVGDVDLLADPLGWLLVLTGVARLRRATPRPLPRPGLVLVAGLAAALASVVLAVPALVQDLSAGQLWPLVVWQPLFCAALSSSLGGLADGSPWAHRLRWLAYAFCVVAALPLVVLAEAEVAFGAVAFAGAIAMLVLIVVLFILHRAPWVHRPAPELSAPA